jgi:hypothetical protein
VLTQPHLYDKAQEVTMCQLRDIAMQVRPWKDALIAAEEESYKGVKARAWKNTSVFVIYIVN